MSVLDVHLECTIIAFSTRKTILQRVLKIRSSIKYYIQCFYIFAILSWDFHPK
jgi:hypothetical protein